MGFEVIDPDNITITANAYITTDKFKIYHKDRGNDFTAITTDIEKAIVAASDYLDERFTFVGERETDDQRLSWPRINGFDIENVLLDGIPVQVEEATSEYALLALTAALNPAPTADGFGRNTKKIKEKVDVIETQVEFFSSALALPEYPAADMKLIRRGLVVFGRGVARGG